MLQVLPYLRQVSGAPALPALMTVSCVPSDLSPNSACVTMFKASRLSARDMCTHLLLLGELAGGLLALRGLSAFVLQVGVRVCKLEEGAPRVRVGVDGWPEGRRAVLRQQLLQPCALLQRISHLELLLVFVESPVLLRSGLLGGLCSLGNSPACVPPAQSTSFYQARGCCCAASCMPCSSLDTWHILDTG